MVILTSLLAAGCSALSKTPQPGGGQEVTPPPAPTLKKPGDYFPLTVGSSWQYLGEGNEYASFKRWVLFAGGNRAQTKTDNGGTVLAAVFEVTDNAVTRIFMQGEEYEDTNFLDAPPNDSTVILKAPLAVGTRWQDPKGITREIAALDAAADTPAGTFENCIKVKVTDQNSIIFEYYREGVGMVKSEFTSGESRVTSTLEKYTIR